MPRRNLNVPYFRQTATLQSKKLALRVKIAQNREQLKAIDDQLRAMKPPKSNPST